MGDWEDIADDWEQLDEEKAAPWDKDDEDAPDNWDDEEEEDNAEDPFGAVSIQRDTPKPKTPGAAASKKKKIKIKPAKKKKLGKKLGEAKVDPVQEKMRQLKLQQDSDLEHAADLLSVDNTVATAPTVSQFIPKTKIEFLKYSSMLVDDIGAYEESEHYVPFIVDLVRKLAGQMTSDQIGEINTALNVLTRQKLQDEKGKKKKQTKAKVFDDFAADDFVDNEEDYSYGFLS